MHICPPVPLVASPAPPSHRRPRLSRTCPALLPAAGSPARAGPRGPAGCVSPIASREASRSKPFKVSRLPHQTPLALFEFAPQNVAHRLIHKHTHFFREFRQDRARDNFASLSNACIATFVTIIYALCLPLPSSAWRSNPRVRGMSACTMLSVLLLLLDPGTCPIAAHQSHCAAAPNSSKPPISREVTCSNTSPHGSDHHRRYRPIPETIPGTCAISVDAHEAAAQS